MNNPRYDAVCVVELPIWLAAYGSRNKFKQTEINRNKPQYKAIFVEKLVIRKNQKIVVSHTV